MWCVIHQQLLPWPPRSACRFNLGTDVLERARTQGKLGLAAVFVWFRFMASRQLVWNKNYNVKPRWGATPAARRMMLHEARGRTCHAALKILSRTSQQPAGRRLKLECSCVSPLACASTWLADVRWRAEKSAWPRTGAPSVLECIYRDYSIDASVFTVL